MKILFTLLILLVGGALSSPPAGQDSSSWVLAWSDEFNGRKGMEVDATKWTAEVGGNGWGNNELEY
ncbi:MAG TPA: hypothetical protein VJW17_07030 [Pyrinomonadaceae bacterium]|nr:hypothetical protein [Pyrinomonadaceae bacterium]